MEQANIDFFGEASLIAGVDEAGRGPLAGPVSAAAVIFPLELSSFEQLSKQKEPIYYLQDSKKLTEKRREELVPVIKDISLAWSVVFVDHETIDGINILQASLLAMKKAILALEICPDKIIVDGNKIPHISKHEFSGQIDSLVKGDSLLPAISAASVLAKVARDQYMVKMHELHPKYNFKKHKGYPTKEHLAMLTQYGPCPIHRLSFSPVKAQLKQIKKI